MGARTDNLSKVVKSCLNRRFSKVLLVEIADWLELSDIYGTSRRCEIARLFASVYLYDVKESERSIATVKRRNKIWLRKFPEGLSQVDIAIVDSALRIVNNDEHGELGFRSITRSLYGNVATKQSFSDTDKSIFTVLISELGGCNWSDFGESVNDTIRQLLNTQNFDMVVNDFSKLLCIVLLAGDYGIWQLISDKKMDVSVVSENDSVHVVIGGDDSNDEYSLSSKTAHLLQAYTGKSVDSLYREAALNIPSLNGIDPTLLAEIPKKDILLLSVLSGSPAVQSCNLPDNVITSMQDCFGISATIVNSLIAIELARFKELLPTSFNANSMSEHELLLCYIAMQAYTKNKGKIESGVVPKSSCETLADDVGCSDPIKLGFRSVSVPGKFLMQRQSGEVIEYYSKECLMVRYNKEYIYALRVDPRYLNEGLEDIRLEPLKDYKHSEVVERRLTSFLCEHYFEQTDYCFWCGLDYEKYSGITFNIQGLQLERGSYMDGLGGKYRRMYLDINVFEKLNDSIFDLLMQIRQEN